MGIRIVYVGKKAFAADNVAGSKKMWMGKGDVQEVTESQARTLLKYPDQWQLADKKDEAAVSQPLSIASVDDDGETVSVDPDALTKPMEKMTKPELVAYAKEKLGKEINPAMSKKLMLDFIEEAQSEAGI